TWAKSTRWTETSGRTKTSWAEASAPSRTTVVLDELTRRRTFLFVQSTVVVLVELSNQFSFLSHHPTRPAGATEPTFGKLEFRPLQFIPCFLLSVVQHCDRVVLGTFADIGRRKGKESVARQISQFLQLFL